MTDKHKHDHCEHENLQYCKHCKVVHCLDCKQEWPEKETVKEFWKSDGWYPHTNEHSGTQPHLINAVSTKTVYDKDRFIDEQSKNIAGLVKNELDRFMDEYGRPITIVKNFSSHK